VNIRQEPVVGVFIGPFPNAGKRPESQCTFEVETIEYLFVTIRFGEDRTKKMMMFQEF
jgi:hypothetical protein